MEPCPISYNLGDITELHFSIKEKVDNVPRDKYRVLSCGLIDRLEKIADKTQTTMNALLH
jgi:hypothetical protein